MHRVWTLHSRVPGKYHRQEVFSRKIMMDTRDRLEEVGT